MRMFKITTNYRKDGKAWKSSGVWVAGGEEHHAIRSLLRLRKVEDKHFEYIYGFTVIDEDYLFCTEAYDTVYGDVQEE